MQTIAPNASRHEAAVWAWNTSLPSRASNCGILDITQYQLAGGVLRTILDGASSNLLHRGEVWRLQSFDGTNQKSKF